MHIKARASAAFALCKKGYPITRISFIALYVHIACGLNRGLQLIIEDSWLFPSGDGAAALGYDFSQVLAELVSRTFSNNFATYQRDSDKC